MRINAFVAKATGLSRRAADKAIQDGQVTVNQYTATSGQMVQQGETVAWKGQVLTLPETLTVIFNKPVGYVVSRNGQGSRTIYDVLPTKFHNLKPVGRLDKDSTGLLLLTSDGQLANRLTHPSFQKQKTYHVRTNKPLAVKDIERIKQGVVLGDGVSRLSISGNNPYVITMHEGRNRQIRRTFDAVGYKVIELHRVGFGDYRLDNLPSGAYKVVN